MPSLVSLLLIPLGLAAGFATAWLASAWALLAWGRKHQAPEPCDVIVVPGARVALSGRPGPALERRIRGAVAYWKAGVAPTLLFSGAAIGGRRSEAQAARQLAEELGVPTAAILLEERATSTEENAHYSLAMLSPSRILLVTEDYHVLRCARMFRRAAKHATGWQQTVVGIRAPTRVAWRMALREVPLVILYGLQRRL